MVYFRNGQKLTKGNVNIEIAFNQGEAGFCVCLVGETLKCLLKVYRAKYRKISLHTAVIIQINQEM